MEKAWKKEVVSQILAKTFHFASPKNSGTSSPHKWHEIGFLKCRRKISEWLVGPYILYS